MCINVIHMSVTISVRIPKELKEEIKKYGINISHVVRKALEEELRKKKIEEAREAAKRLGEFFSKIPEEDIVKCIKISRKSY
jgi:antitoxin CcdA